MNKRLVVIESPYMGNTEKTIAYARACMKDCLLRGEYPFASHLLYTQEGILDDNISTERKLGIEAGFKWSYFAKTTVVYIDLGISKGMVLGVRKALEAKRLIEYRSLKTWRKK